MKTTIPLILLTLLLQWTATAQKENNIWAIGEQSGFDFNSGTPILYSTAMKGREGSANVCDAAGNLLFYTNNEYVWDKTNSVMPNGHLMPNSSSSQGVTIVPIIEMPGQYYIFSVDQSEAGTKYLRYSIVDIALNAGNGDIVSGKKNVPIKWGMGEKITMAHACSGLWLITHNIDSPIFYAFKIHPSGLIDSPIISTTTGTSGLRKYNLGEIQMSPNGTKIIRCNSLGWDLFSFDSKTGIIGSTPIVSALASANPPGEHDASGAAFSEDGSKLYTTGNFVYQYDISLLPSSALVLASKYKLTSLVTNIAMRRGPDGKIYTATYADLMVSCIQEPNKAGAACNVAYDVPSLRQTIANFHQHMGNQVLVPIMPKAYTDTFDFCIGDEIILKSTAGMASYKWNDGDTSYVKKVNNSGVFWVESYDNCLARIDTFKVFVTERDTQISRTLINSCFENSVSLVADTSFSSWLWDNGTIDAMRAVGNAGTYWVINQKEKCQTKMDTFFVTLTNFETQLNDTTICKGEEIVLDASIGMDASYRWQDGSINNIFRTQKAGQYSVTISVANCSKTDTINVLSGSSNLDLGNDTTVCKDIPFDLESGVGAANYMWNNGSSDEVITIHESGKYILTVEKNGCTESDTISISVVECSNCIKIPNAFTPNGDGRNDFFGPIINCPVINYSIMIVNRYGQEVFTSRNPAEKWDGKFNNMDQQLGVYYYLAKVKFDYPESVNEIYKGDFTLIK